MSKAMRRKMSAELETRFKAVKDCAIIGFKQLSATQASELRLNLHESGLRMNVVKNSCAGHAFEKLAAPGLQRLLDGPSAIVWGGDDPSHMARLLIGWSDKYKNIEVRGGLLQGGSIGPDKLRGLASLPARKMLIGMTVSAVAAPLSKFISAHIALLRELAGCVSAVKEKLEKASTPAG